jgi:hypothetical protein
LVSIKRVSPAPRQETQLKRPSARLTRGMRLGKGGNGCRWPSCSDADSEGSRQRPGFQAL